MAIDKLNANEMLHCQDQEIESLRNELESMGGADVFLDC